MSNLGNDAINSESVCLRPFQAINGNRIAFQLIEGEVLDYQKLSYRKKRDQGWLEKIEHQIWLMMADGSEECLRLSSFSGEVSPEQYLILLIGTNGDRYECVAIYNQSTAQIFYRPEVWGKLLDDGCFLPVLVLLFVFPLSWLAIVVIAFKLSLRPALAIVIPPAMAAVISITLYVLLTAPVPQLFRRHIKAIFAQINAHINSDLE